MYSLLVEGDVRKLEMCKYFVRKIIQQYYGSLKLSRPFPSINNHEMMKILFIDNCSQETYLADVSIRCSSNPPQSKAGRATRQMRKS